MQTQLCNMQSYTPESPPNHERGIKRQSSPSFDNRPRKKLALMWEKRPVEIPLEMTVEDSTIPDLTDSRGK